MSKSYHVTKTCDTAEYSYFNGEILPVPFEYRFLQGKWQYVKNEQRRSDQIAQKMHRKCTLLHGADFYIPNAPGDDSDQTARMKLAGRTCTSSDVAAQ